jgi:hypothetical protein
VIVGDDVGDADTLAGPENPVHFGEHCGLVG